MSGNDVIDGYVMADTVCYKRGKMLERECFS
jgi:hypothetical protein